MAPNPKKRMQAVLDMITSIIGKQNVILEPMQDPQFSIPPKLPVVAPVRKEAVSLLDDSSDEFQKFLDDLEGSEESPTVDTLPPDDGYSILQQERETTRAQMATMKRKLIVVKQKKDMQHEIELNETRIGCLKKMQKQELDHERTRMQI